MADTETTPSLAPQTSMGEPELPPFLNLPAELIHHVLSFLSPFELIEAASTCRLLYEHSKSDRLWEPFVQSSVPGQMAKKPDDTTWKDLYITHDPYWFIPRHKIWFADTPHTGKLLIARYDHRLPAIEAYALVAERRQPTVAHWDWNPDTIIHTFSPKIQLDLNAPVLRLEEKSFGCGIGDHPSRLSKEIPMDIHGDPKAAGLKSRFMLTRPLPHHAIRPNTAIWPPHIIPSAERTRNQSSNSYRGTDHRPTSHSLVSTLTFRLRKWMEFSPRLHGISMRVGEDVPTYATLAPEIYTPTKQKPWQGIWCGDYAGHGCEFLVIMQPDEADALPLPELAQRTLHRRTASVSSGDSWTTAPLSPALDEELEILEDIVGPTSDLWRNGASNGDAIDSAPEVDEDGTVYQGRIEAVKLTGDPNIPRGEYTFIAPDIGRDGLLRIANEDIFKGARVVRSVGHIAANGFREDDFIPSQLILISHNKLAQYWETFGHVSFYERVDIDQFTRIP